MRATQAEERRGERAIAQGGLLRILAYLSSGFTGLLATAVISRHLGVEEFGAYAAVLTAGGLAGFVLIAGLPTLSARELSLAPERERALLLGRLSGLAMLANLAGIIILAGALALAGWESELLLGLGIWALAQSAQSAGLIQIAALIAAGRVRPAAGLEASIGLLAPGAAVIAALAGASMQGVLAASLPPMLLFLLMGARVNHARPLLAVSWRLWGRLLRESLPVAAGAGGVILLSSLAVVLSQLLAPPAQVGLFALAARLHAALAVIPQLLAGTMVPLLARNSEKRQREILRGMERRGLWMGGLLALLLFLLAPLLVQLLAGEQYRAAVPLVRGYALLLPLGFLSAAWASALVARGSSRSLLGGTGCALAVSGLSALIMIPSLEAAGALLSVIAGETVLAGFYARAVRKAGLPLFAGRRAGQDKGVGPEEESTSRGGGAVS